MPNDVLVRAMDRIFILHADHEQNASTSTVRLCGSSGTNPCAAIAAGVACLWGPAHGGANEAALNMLEDMDRMGGVEKIGEFIKQVKDKNSNVKLMGFGHRVYKNYDPRAVAPLKSWRGRPILYSGSLIISFNCAIQPTVRASAKMAVNRLTGIPSARCTMPE